MQGVCYDVPLGVAIEDVDPGVALVLGQRETRELGHPLVPDEVPGPARRSRRSKVSDPENRRSVEHLRGRLHLSLPLARALRFEMLKQPLDLDEDPRQGVLAIADLAKQAFSGLGAPPP